MCDHCGTKNCGCTPSAPFRIGDLTKPISQLSTQLQSALAASHTLAPFYFYHVVTTQPVTAPTEPAYSVGDVLVLQKLGNQCLWTNRSTDTVITGPDTLDHITPLEGESGIATLTVPAATTAYFVSCADNGFTSVQVACPQAMRVSPTLAGLASAATSVTVAANLPLVVSRNYGDPRVAPFYVQPQASGTLSILYTS